MLATLVFILAIFWLPQNGSSYSIDGNPYHRLETLDSRGNYQLVWLVDWDRKSVLFNVTVKTKGYVGFGLSAKGKMSGSDLIIGGVRPNGQVYFSDRHAVGNQLPEVDESQDWKLHTGWENATHTFLSFSRDFDTCDDLHDYPITEDTVSLLWAYGERDDELEYHHQNRGDYAVHLLLPDYSPQIVHDSYTAAPRIIGNDSSEVQVWTMRRVLRLPPSGTTYWCTMHKAPKLHKKHHAIGFEVRFSSEESQRHTHHIVVYKCYPPAGQSARSLFEPFVNGPGQACLSNTEPVGPMPVEYCTGLYQMWGIGGRQFFLPSHIGQALGESEDEYYVTQVHYDNPNLLDNVVVDDSMDVYYTSKLRPNEGGILTVRVSLPGLPPSILIPPSSVNHKIRSYCSSACTERMFPREGITIAGGLLHSHNSGFKVKVQHFRGIMVEQPWVLWDDNFNNRFQHIRTAPTEVQVLPGDTLVFNCEYDNTWTTGTVVGGFSTREEMCSAQLYYYNKMEDYYICASEFDSEEARYKLLGVRNVTRYPHDTEFTVLTPRNLTGLKITEVSDNHVEWDLQRRKELQDFHLGHAQINSCNKGQWNPDDFSVETTYPFRALPYSPQRTCTKH